MSRVCLKKSTNCANKVNRQLNPGLNFSHELDLLVTLHVFFIYLKESTVFTSFSFSA